MRRYIVESIITKTNIENIIYEIREKQVMLDSDLAKLYGVQTKRINEAVKNNLDKFPERFSFVLTDEESDCLLVENFDQKIERRGGRYKTPRVLYHLGSSINHAGSKTFSVNKIEEDVVINLLLEKIRR